MRIARRMSCICSRCVEDSYLKRLISSSGEPGRCSVCHTERKRTFSAEQMAGRLAGALMHLYTPGEQIPYSVPESDSPDWRQEGKSLDMVVQDLIGQYLGFEDEIVDALIR